MSAESTYAASMSPHGINNLNGSRSTFVFTTACLAIILFALVPASTRIAGLQLDGVSIGLIRAIGAGILTAPLLVICRLRLPNDLKDLGLLLVYAFGNFAGFPLLFSLGTQSTSGTHAALIMATMPSASWSHRDCVESLPATVQLVPWHGHRRNRRSCSLCPKIPPHPVQGLPWYSNWLAHGPRSFGSTAGSLVRWLFPGTSPRSITFAAHRHIHANMRSARFVCKVLSKE